MNRHSMTRIPIWVRVPAIIALALVGVLVGSILLGTWDGHGSGGGHGSRDRMEMSDRTGGGRGHGSDGETETRDHTSGDGHDSGSETETRDHGG
jgi:hypothetical protein